MNIKRLLITTSAVFTLALGAGVAIGLSNDKLANESVTEVKATDYIITNPRVYFVPHANWVKEGNERFKMNYYYGENFVDSVEMTLYGTSTVPGPYYNRKVYMGYVSNNSASRIQICRMNSDYSSQYNYSGQIYLTEGNSTPVLMMEEDVNYWNDWTTSSNGVWFTSLKQNAVYKTTDQHPSNNTGRVFFYNSGTHWSSAAGCAVYAWGGSASPRIWSNQTQNSDATIYNLNWFTDDNGESYGYADIPTDITGYKFCTISDVNKYFTSVGYYSDTEFVADSFAYVRYGLASGNAISTGGAKNDVAGANLMKKVIEAYNTCSSSVLNGYGAYTALNTNFYSHATSAAKEATHKSLGGNTLSIKDHFDAMKDRSGANGGSLKTPTLFGNTMDESNSAVAIVAITVIALASAGGFFLLRRKREEN